MKLCLRIVLLIFLVTGTLSEGGEQTFHFIFIRNAIFFFVGNKGEPNLPFKVTKERHRADVRLAYS